MFKGGVALAERTVGVVDRDDALLMPGCTLFCAGLETYLIDADGRVVHEWRSERPVFAAYLLPNGNLLRDGSENEVAVAFRAGGAAGWVEEVTWEGAPVWSFAKLPYDAFLTHHDLEPMPNGHVLMLCWERKTKAQALQAGRRPELIPDGEVWNNLTLELAPDGKGGASVVWSWSLWDHLAQDYDPARDNYVADVAAHPELFDINYCPPGGKACCRNADMLKGKGPFTNPMGLSVFSGGPQGGDATTCTGEKDWIHANSVAYDPVRDQVMVSFNVPSELILVDHGTTAMEAAGHTGGRRGQGGDILYRWGNPQVYRAATRKQQQLFCQHSANFIRPGVYCRAAEGEGRAEGCGAGNILVFNNGAAPHRLWSTVDEIVPPDHREPGVYPRESGGAFGPEEPVWRHGPAAGRRDSFYCTHISGCQRLPNGNTLITMGPQGILVEVTAAGEEVWRYISPVMIHDTGVAFTRQGQQRAGGRYSLFRALRYALDHPALAGRDLPPGRALEA
jgi:hypothetical protein